MQVAGAIRKGDRCWYLQCANQRFVIAVRDCKDFTNDTVGLLAAGEAVLRKNPAIELNDGFDGYIESGSLRVTI
jgi:hypothetical protein